MAVLRPWSKAPDSAIEDVKAKVIQVALGLFTGLSFQGEYPLDGIGIQTVRPNHVFSSNLVNTVGNWVMSIGTALTWQDGVNLTINRSDFVLPTGVFNRSGQPSIVEVRGRANGDDLPVTNIEEMYTWDLARGYFERPFFAMADNNLTIRIIGELSKQDRFGLLGYVVAKRANLITESGAI